MKDLASQSQYETLSSDIDITIDDGFKAMIPPLSSEERAQLEQNIVEHGCRDPLVVWPLPEWTGEDSHFWKWADATIKPHGDGGYETYRVWPSADGGDGAHESEWPFVLIDGHNRYEICNRLGIDYRVVILDLPTREAAEDWMDANQLGRRNISPDTFKYILGRRYNRTKKTKAEAGAIGGASKGHFDPCLSASETTADKLASEHGISSTTVKRAAKFAEEVERTPELKEAIETGKPVLQVKRELKERHREERRAENRAKIEAVPDVSSAITTGTFSTIVIDPPWDWADEGDQDQLGRSRPDYSTMSIAELMELPLDDLSDDDCHLYLWITNRSLPKGFALMERWGFRYITTVTWVKPHFGMGNYFRGQTEHVLFGVKGSQPLKRKDLGTAFHAARGAGGHSSKPPEFLDLVESASPGPYLEMFSRNERSDWTAWGENANG